MKNHPAHLHTRTIRAENVEQLLWPRNVGDHEIERENVGLAKRAPRDSGELATTA
jgi:hypothetical protein